MAPGSRLRARPFLLLLALTWAAASARPAGCKLRITDRSLDMLKSETQKLVEQELSVISVPDMHGKEGSFRYNISDVKITELNLTWVNMSFLPETGVMFDVRDSSIALNFHRELLYWFFSDTGRIEASAEGVRINAAFGLGRDADGRLRISNVSCQAKIRKMRAKFNGTLGGVYNLLGGLLTTGMRLLLNKQICPALRHAALVHVNSLLESVPVRTEVDGYVGIDYSLTDDPPVTSRSLDVNFRGMFFHLRDETDAAVPHGAEPVIREYDRMVYLALSEFFFDSALFSYHRAEMFQMKIGNDNMPKELEMVLRTGYFGNIMMLDPALLDAPVSLELAVKAPPKSSVKTSGATVAMKADVKVMSTPAGRKPVQISSMTMECEFNAKVFIRGKRLAMQADLRRFKIYSNRSALESLALIPLQAPLKAMLQKSLVPLINNRTTRGVRIPLADGVDLIEEVVEYHNAFLVIGANLHFSKGLREMVAAAQ